MIWTALVCSRAREEKDAAEESMRRQKAKDAQNHFREELADQIKGRQLARNKAKAEHVAEDVAMEVAYKVSSLLPLVWDALLWLSENCVIVRIK